MTGCRIREVGDAALVMECPPAIDTAVNTRVLSVARSMAGRGVRGVLDVLPTFHAVAVHFDPVVANIGDVRSALERAIGEPVEEVVGAAVDVPVVYGGDAGPDLVDVARAAGLTPEAVVERHAAAEYRVYMMGFLPGFAYLASVDPSIAVPRRATPRLRVAAGSVGIAGLQTGIYPFDSPGGWQIIGRTMLPMFDRSRTPPARLAPGDRVRFVPVSTGAIEQEEARPGSSEPHSSADHRGARDRGLTVVTPGLLTTIQDEGRWGYQHLGVPVSGALDRVSHRRANLLVGNDPGAATLEVTLAGPELRLDADTVVAIGGADLEASLDGRRVPTDAPVRAPSHSVLRFGARRAGGRAYVAFAGGLAVSPVLGSRSTHVRTRMGGIAGRALKAGDWLAFGEASPHAAVGIDPPVRMGTGARLRVVPGPHEEYFPASAFEILTSSRFVVTPESDRMGYRLSADRPIPRRIEPELISGATFTGALQVPESGRPILLMADRATTGGYPQIAVVISADLPIAGQLVPGDWVEFDLCSMTDARAAAASAIASRRGAAGRDVDGS
jgi:KipI family sensor histidine kinase inhibitor